MYKFLIFGAGQMGIPIGHALHKFGNEVYFYDENPATYQHVKKIDNGDNKIKIYPHNVVWKKGFYNVVISAATYSSNIKIAEKAFDNNTPYCDLGGHVETSRQILELSKQKGVLAFTDLGLAPGLVNIIGTSLCEDLIKYGDKPKELYLRVGGLPNRYDIPSNELKYACTWSLDGLLNEYMDDCVTIVDNQELMIPGLSIIEKVDWEFPLTFEAFNTSGGLSHTINYVKKNGINRANYKTLRYSEHCKYMQFLIRALSGDKNKLKDVLYNLCRPKNLIDEVYIYTRVIGVHNDWIRKYKIVADNMWSAMQKCTAFSAATVAQMIATKNVVEVGYEHIDYTMFKNYMEVLGIEL